MQTSDTISKIAIAVSKMQGQLQGAEKGANNPFHRSKYANLESVWDACRNHLAQNELAVIQAPSFKDGRMCLETTLTHSSGEWFRSELSLRPKDDTPQGIGSTITYAKRYSLMAMVGIADTDDDDDGNAGSFGRKPSKKVEMNENSVFNNANEAMSQWLEKAFSKLEITDRSMRVTLSAQATRDNVKLKDMSAYINQKLEHQND